MKKKIKVLETESLSRFSEVKVRPGSHKKYGRISPEDKIPGVVQGVNKNGTIKVQFMDEDEGSLCEGAYDLDMEKEDLIPTGKISPLFYGNEWFKKDFDQKFPYLADL